MLLDPGFNLTLRPIRYPQFYEMYKAAVKNTWTVEEVDFSTDIMDLKSKLSAGDRHLIHRLVAFFATGDSIVSNNLVLNLYKHINAPEARMYLSRQLFEEALHVEFYLTLLDTYVEDHKEREQAFQAIDNIPSISRKADFCFKWIDSINNLDKIQTKAERRQFLLNLICFATCIEGLFFFSAFAYVYFYRHRGFLQGLATGTNWVFRDESCVDGETQVLTPSGWIPICELQDGVKVAQYGIDNGKISFVTPEKVIRKAYSGKMYRYYHEKGGIDQFLTADHDMVQKWDHQVQYLKQKASDFIPNGKKMIPVSGFVSEHGPGLTYEERFLIALQADGSFSDPVRNGKLCGTVPINFTFKKQRKIDRLVGFLKELGWTHSSFITKKNATVFTVNVPNNIFLSKHFSDWVNISTRSVEWCTDFIEEITHWDGHFPKGGHYKQYITTVEENADLVQAIATLSGHHCFKSPRVDMRKDTYKDVYNCYSKDQQHVRCATLHKEETDFDGQVYCVTVPTGAFVIRRNNKVSITGNCHLRFAMAVADQVRSEEPDLFDASMQSQIKEMIAEAIDCEVQFATDILSKGVVGLSVPNIRQYMQYVADNRFGMLKMPPQYKVSNPLPFMVHQDVDSLANFFERRVSSYQTGISGSVNFDENF